VESNSMRSLVSGGSGFIGNALVQRLLDRGDSVRVLDVRECGIDGVEWVRGGVEDVSAAARAVQGMETVYHLAAEHADDVQPISRYYEVNVDGTRALLPACTAAGVHRLVFTSTVALYGLKLDGATEDTEPEPFNDYGASKLQAEEIVAEWVSQDDRNRAAIVRPCVVIGPGNRGNVYNLFRQVAGRGPLIIGSGDIRKSMAYVENIADFLVFCAGLDHRLSVFNYADKPDMTTRELVALAARELGKPGRIRRIPYPLALTAGYGFDLVARATGRRFPISAIRVRKFCASSVIDATKAFTTGFEPRYSLEEGVHAMLAGGAEP
jgi:GlcNAc-P-P-Und epimerase